MESEEREVQMVLVFPWGLELKFQPNPNWPIGDMKDQFLDPEPEVIDLDSDDEAIRGLKDMIIVSDDFD